MERWVASGLREWGPRVAYPVSLSGGDHGWVVEGVAGQVALVRVGGLGPGMVVDLAGLWIRRVRLGGFVSAPVAVQPGLF